MRSHSITQYATTHNNRSSNEEEGSPVTNSKGLQHNGEDNLSQHEKVRLSGVNSEKSQLGNIQEIQIANISNNSFEINAQHASHTTCHELAHPLHSIDQS